VRAFDPIGLGNVPRAHRTHWRGSHSKHEKFTKAGTQHAHQPLSDREQGDGTMSTVFMSAADTTARYLREGLDERAILARVDVAIGKTAEQPFDPDDYQQTIDILGLAVVKSDDGFIPDYRLRSLADDHGHQLAAMLLERRILRRSIARQDKHERYIDHQTAVRALAVAKSRVTAAQLDVECAKIALDDAHAMDVTCAKKN
jgi:hypothetical protein